MSFAKQVPLPQRFVWPVAGELRETLLWPCRGSQPKAALLLIPGNPGLIDLYIGFASAIHKAHGDGLEVVGMSHLGHTQFSDNTGQIYRNSKRYSLSDHIANCVAAFDMLDAEYSKLTPRPKMLLCGHSVGCYIAEKIIESRHDRIDRVFSLFPTVEHIADTPRGHQLQMLFRPYARKCISGLVEGLTWILPASALYSLGSLSGSLNADSSKVVIDKLIHWSCVNNALKMADDEMRMIADLDSGLYTKHGHKFVMYYGAADHWVPQSHYDRMKGVNATGKVILCENNIGHAFVTTHPGEMADILVKLLHEELAV